MKHIAPTWILMCALLVTCVASVWAVDTTQPSTTGTLVIKVIQGTPDGEAPAGMPVTIDMYQGSRKVKSIQDKVDQHGVVILENLEIGMGLQPVATVHHGGVSYRAFGQPLTADQPDQILRVTIYESSDQPPAWNITMRHVIVQPEQQSLHVSEIVAIHNPSNRTWQGIGVSDLAKLAELTGANSEANCEGHVSGAITFTLLLPAAASDIELGSGFQSCCARVEGGRIINAEPMLPGTSEFSFSYHVPVENGQAHLELLAAAPVQHTMVMLPPEVNVLTAVGLEGGDIMDTAARKIRVYKAAQMQPADRAELTMDISNVIAVSAAGSTVGLNDGSSASLGNAKVIVAAVAALMLLAAVMVLLKPTRKTVVNQA